MVVPVCYIGDNCRFSFANGWVFSYNSRVLPPPEIYNVSVWSAFDSDHFFEFEGGATEATCNSYDEVAALIQHVRDAPPP